MCIIKVRLNACKGAEMSSREEELLNILKTHATRMRQVDALIAEQATYSHDGDDEVSVAIRDYYANVNKVFAPSV